MKELKRVALGADHGGYDLKTILAAHLQKAGHQVEDVGTSSREVVDYPVFARVLPKPFQRVEPMLAS